MNNITYLDVVATGDVSVHVAVESSVIAMVSFSSHNSALTVSFKNGSKYRYDGFSLIAFLRLVNATSVGKAFQEVKQAFHGVKLVESLNFAGASEPSERAYQHPDSNAFISWD